MATIFRNSLMQDVRDYVIITIGLLLYSIGFSCFQLPYEITSGGLAGAGAVIFYATGFPVQYTFFLVNIILLIIAVRVLGWRFCIKTIYAVFMLTFLLGMAQEVMRTLAVEHPRLVRRSEPEQRIAAGCQEQHLPVVHLGCRHRRYRHRHRVPEQRLNWWYRYHCLHYQ